MCQVGNAVANLADVDWIPALSLHEELPTLSSKAIYVAHPTASLTSISRQALLRLGLVVPEVGCAEVTGMVSINQAFNAMRPTNV